MTNHGVVGISFSDNPDIIANTEDIGSLWKVIPRDHVIEEICFSSMQRQHLVDNYEDLSGVRSDKYARGYFLGFKAIISNLGGASHYLIGIGNSSDGANVSINWYTMDGRGVEKEYRCVKDCGICYRVNAI